MQTERQRAPEQPHTEADALEAGHKRQQRRSKALSRCQQSDALSGELPCAPLSEQPETDLRK
jgi:hypothetical protein